MKNIVCLLVFLWVLPQGPYTSADEVDVSRLSRSQWITMESPSFVVFSDASEKNTFAIVEELENFKYLLPLMLGYEQKPIQRKIPVVIAKNRRSFVSMGISDDYAGLFIQRDGGVIFARADRFRASAQGGSNWGRVVVLHELVHLLLDYSPAGLANRPPWFNEGIAEYFGTYTQDGDELIIGDMSIVHNRFYSMVRQDGRGYRSIDSRSLFKTTQSDLEVGDVNRQQSLELDRFYARAFAVVHYLSADRDRRLKMNQYFWLLDNGASVDDAFNMAFAMSFEEFDDLVEDYIFGEYVYARVFPRGDNGIEFPPVEVEKHQLSELDSMRFLYRKIALLIGIFLNEVDVEQMNTDFEKLYPDFFQ